MDDWRKDKTTFAEKVKFLFKKNNLSDVMIYAGEGATSQIFPGHKLILSTASTILDDMLFKDNVSEIKFTDYSPAAVEILLQYIYTDKMFELDICDVTDAFEAYQLAMSLNMDSFKYKAEIILRNITLSNALKIYVNSCKLNIHILQKISFEYIEVHANQIIKLKDFQSLPSVRLEEIMKSSKLNIGLQCEYMLFESLIQWGVAEIQRLKEKGVDKTLRSLIEPFLPYIRFLTMTPRQFVLKVVEKNILTVEESFSLLVKIVHPLNTTVRVPFRFSLDLCERKYLNFLGEPSNSRVKDKLLNYVTPTSYKPRRRVRSVPIKDTEAAAKANVIGIATNFSSLSLK